eukprot:evm.model.scf_404.3 EVM.evm.TU.scf_404.3   scf_404:66256-70198(+)
MELYVERTDQVPQYLVDKYEQRARKYWETFFKRNEDRFFKDRHYIDTELPEVTWSNVTILEVGCGSGSTVYPLRAANPQATIYAVDFSAKAIELVMHHPEYDAAKVHAFVADLTCDPLSQHIAPKTVDICTMVFVLSAISPEKMPKVLRSVAEVLDPEVGCLYFRDYAKGDLAEQRFAAEGRQQKLAENFYVRGDGTRCYYFSKEYVLSLFEGEGFTCTSIRICERKVENRAQKLVMHRKWVQAVFKLHKDGDGACSHDAAEALDGGSRTLAGTPDDGALDAQ